MTITKYDRVAIIPKRCDICNRLFWLEPYNIYYKSLGIGANYVKEIDCRKCEEKNKA
jgi:Tfp pilus assembly protein PilZ